MVETSASSQCSYLRGPKLLRDLSPMVSQPSCKKCLPPRPPTASPSHRPSPLSATEKLQKQPHVLASPVPIALSQVRSKG